MSERPKVASCYPDTTSSPFTRDGVSKGSARSQVSRNNSLPTRRHGSGHDPDLHYTGEEDSSTGRKEGPLEGDTSNSQDRGPGPVPLSAGLSVHIRGPGPRCPRTRVRVKEGFLGGQLSTPDLGDKLITGNRTTPLVSHRSRRSSMYKNYSSGLFCVHFNSCSIYWN